jgi:acetyl esterase/lipase
MSMTTNLSKPTVNVTERNINGPHGPIRIRIYEPVNSETPIAGLVWCHGGAWAGGDLDMPEADWVARSIAERGIPVVSVDYRLAPTPAFFAEQGFPVKEGKGYHFPVASEEISAVFEWVAKSGEFRVPQDRWSLGGGSAGANLAAGATLRLRDQGRVMPKSLLLVYGLFHAKAIPVRAELADKLAAPAPAGAILTPKLVAAISNNYVGDPALLSSPYAFPGGHVLTGLPPTLVLNADADYLRTSGELFAFELSVFGVIVLQIRENGTYHGYFANPESAAAVQSIERMLAWLTMNPLVSTSQEQLNN